MLEHIDRFMHERPNAKLVVRLDAKGHPSAWLILDAILQLNGKADTLGEALRELDADVGQAWYPDERCPGCGHLWHEGQQCTDPSCHCNLTSDLEIISHMWADPDVEDERLWRRPPRARDVKGDER